MSSPTQRSLKALRGDGWNAWIVEKWIPQIKRRLDCWGADILACKPGVGIKLVQTTSGSNQAQRLAKVLTIPEAQAWLESGGQYEIHGWAKRGPRGKRKVWTCTSRLVTLADFVEDDLSTETVPAFPVPAHT
jgi:hypothetical protein